MIGNPCENCHDKKVTPTYKECTLACGKPHDYQVAIEAIATNNKEWVEWIEKTFYPPANWSDFDYEVWKKRKKKIGL